MIIPYLPDTAPEHTAGHGPSALLAFLLAKCLGKRVDELFFLEGETP